MLHPSQDRLLRYATGDSKETEAVRIIGHLDGCPACTERVHALRAMAQDFEGSWESFMEEAAYRAALPEAAPSKPVVEATLRGWLGRVNQLATVAMERLTATGPAAGLRAAFAPVYSGAASPDASAAAVTEAEAASQACGRGDLEATLQHLRQASARNPQISASAGIDLELEERTAGRIVLDAARGSASVLVYPDILEGVRGTVVFEQADKTRTLELRPVPGAVYLLAEIEGLDDGPISVRLNLHSQ